MRIAWCRRAAVTAALAVAMTGVFTLTAHASPKHGQWWTTCKPYFRRTISGPWGAYIIRDDVFKIPGVRRARICIRHERGTPAFAVVSSDAASAGPSVAYPEVFWGCAYGACSPGSILPRKVGRLPARLRVSSYDRIPRGGGKFDAGFDIWFSFTERRTGQARAAEVMIWYYDRGVRFVPQWRVRAGGTWWLAEEWETRNRVTGVSWPLLIFMREHQSQHVRRLPLAPFIRFGEQGGWIKRGDWLESVQHGYEIWAGGAGLLTTFFRVLP